RLGRRQAQDRGRRPARPRHRARTVVRPVGGLGAGSRGRRRLCRPRAAPVLMADTGRTETARPQQDPTGASSSGTVYVTLGPDQESAADVARAAEAAGFDGVSWGEHLFFHGATPNAFVSLAAAAGATSRIRLLTSVVILPLYPAALAAKLAATLD